MTGRVYISYYAMLRQRLQGCQEADVVAEAQCCGQLECASTAHVLLYEACTAQCYSVCTMHMYDTSEVLLQMQQSFNSDRGRPGLANLIFIEAVCMQSCWCNLALSSEVTRCTACRSALIDNSMHRV
jgi:hypothetical protein